ncbi:MAG: divergent polysaccharide deacetylase family protein [Candidatus Omnitrophica bacterium]|jgi:hypothetical protein|nr:divergent polysaccharide deacetylase family protein [Candidatus Omnitrophota bacterium]
MKKENIIIIILSAIVLIQAIIIFVFLRPQPKARPHIKKPPVAFKQEKIKGEIAIVLDDWGYNQSNLEALRGLSKYPLTIAILPNLPYSSFIAREARAMKFETILHLPLEPYGNYKLENNTIVTSMSKKQIRNIIENSLKNVGEVKGVNNHMGSKATASKQTMAVVLGVLKEKGLYFLDSLVSDKSVCQKQAKEAGVAFAKRNVFLDNQNNAVYVRNQIYKLKAKARVSGYAIGIGHDRANTIVLLEEELPKMEREGFKLVFVSQIAK